MTGTHLNRYVIGWICKCACAVSAKYISITQGYRERYLISLTAIRQSVDLLPGLFVLVCWYLSRCFLILRCPPNAEWYSCWRLCFSYSQKAWTFFFLCSSGFQHECCRVYFFIIFCVEDEYGCLHGIWSNRP